MTTKIPTITSLKEKLSSEKKAENKKELESKESLNAAKRNKPFDNTHVKVAWKGFLTQNKAQSKDQVVNLLKQEYKLEGDHLKILITNEVQRDIFDKIRIELQKYLRDSIGNDFLSLSVELIAIESNRTPYTNKEKFDHLANKNPALKMLQERLGLDPDF